MMAIRGKFNSFVKIFPANIDFWIANQFRWGVRLVLSQNDCVRPSTGHALTHQQPQTSSSIYHCEVILRK